MHQLAKPKRHYLAEDVASIILKEIEQGRWLDWLPSERRLLRSLSVSRLTLRQALRRLSSSGAVQVVPRRGYRILPARSGADKASHAREVGLLCPDPLFSYPPLIGQVMDGLRALCSEAEMHLEVFENRLFHTVSPEQILPDLVKSNPKGCWVLLMANRRMQEWFAKSHVPAVIYGNLYPRLNLPSVGFDYQAIILHATSTLLGKGHRNIAFLGYQPDSAGDQQSVEGFNKAIQTAGPTASGTTLWAEGDDIEGICRKVDRALRLAQPPTAFIVGRTHHYLTVATHLNRRGFRIPEDISLICRMEDMFLHFVRPEPATYHTNPENLTQKLFRAVSAVAAGDAAPVRQAMIIPDFCPGGSVAARG